MKYAIYTMLLCTSCPRNTVFDPKKHFFCPKISKKRENRNKSEYRVKMLELKIFVRDQIFRRRPIVPYTTSATLHNMKVIVLSLNLNNSLVGEKVLNFIICLLDPLAPLPCQYFMILTHRCGGTRMFF